MTDEYGADWLTSGGIDDEWVTFRNVKFECVIESQDPTQPFLILDIVPDDTEMGAIEEKRFGIGGGWEENEDGSGVTRTDSRKPAFHRSSKAGRLLESFLTNGGRQHAANRDGAPFDAAWWEGMHGRIKENKSSFPDRESGETIEFSYFTLEETDGWNDGGTAKGKGKTTAKKAATKAPAKKAASKKAAAKPDPEPEPEPEPTPEAASSGGGGDSDLEAKVRDHCANTSADSHDEWMMEVYAEIPEVADDEAVQGLVDDENGIWGSTWD